MESIIAFFQSIPALRDFFNTLMLLWMNARLKAHDTDFEQATRDLLTIHDQRKLEAAVGSDNAGKSAIHPDGVQTRARQGSSG